MKKELMRYIPKEYKKLVVDIYEGEKFWNDITNRWNTEVVVEWENGEISKYANKAHMKGLLKEFYFPSDFEAK